MKTETKSSLPANDINAIVFPSFSLLDLTVRQKTEIQGRKREREKQRNCRLRFQTRFIDKKNGVLAKKIEKRGFEFIILFYIRKKKRNLVGES